MENRSGGGGGGGGGGVRKNCKTLGSLNEKENIVEEGQCAI